MVTFGKRHIQYIPKKTLHRRREASQKPLLPVLMEITAYSKCGL